MMNELMTLSEVAGFLHVTKKTAYKYLIQWKVPLVRHGRFVRIHLPDLNVALNNNKHSW